MDFQKKKVLVVEDDQLLRKIIIGQLSLKYLTIPAGDGQSALEQVEIQKPDIVVLDLMLPKLDGFGFLEKLRASPDPEWAKIPVLVASNLSDSKSIQRAKEYGILEYYIKADIGSGTLLNRINRYFTQGDYFLGFAGWPLFTPQSRADKRLWPILDKAT